MKKHIFLSYSSKDAEFAEWLEQELESNDYVVWRDKTSLRSGDKWEKMIEQALEEAWLVIVVQSLSSKEARWVINEIEFAQNRNIPIIPFLLEGDTWFRLMHIQYIDVREREKTPLPDEFYATLLQYAPPVSLEDEFPHDISMEDTSQLLSIIPKLKRIGGNSKSPRARAARELLKQLSKDSDEILAAAAGKALSSLKPIPHTPIATASVNKPVSQEVLPAPELSSKPVQKRTMGIWLPIIGILVIAVIAIIVLLITDDGGTNGTSPTEISQPATPTSSSPVLIVGATSVEVRSGPGNEYGEIGTARNENLPVTGKSESGDYLRVVFEGQDGWIRYTTNVTLQGELSNVMVLSAPPTPLLPATRTPRPTNTPQPTATPIVAGSVLLEENFEDKLSQEFVITRGIWQFDTEDNGNIVLASQNTDGYSNIDFGEPSWRNYSVEYKVKIVETDTQAPPVMLFFRFACNSEGGKCNSYIQTLSPYWKVNELSIMQESGAWQTLNQVEMNVKTDVWYTIKVIVQGFNIQVFIDGDLSLNFSDDQVDMGSLGLSVGPNTYARFDDIKVVAWNEE